MLGKRERCMGGDKPSPKGGRPEPEGGGVTLTLIGRRVLGLGLGLGLGLLGLLGKE